MQTKSFKDLVVWQRSMELVEIVYKVAKKLPQSETFALVSQVQRAAVSIPSNIAEGYGRNNRKEYIHFLGMANASCAELETQLLLISRIYPAVKPSKAFNLLIETQKMLAVMRKKLR